LPVRTRLTRKEALILALMASENRAAHALGRTYPGGLTAFVAQMNIKARELGLRGTRFEDPSGLSGGNVASARDLARLVDAAHHYPQIRDFSTRDTATLRSGRRSLQFINTNALVRGRRWRIGLSKTGYLEEAGQCLVMQTRLANRPVVIVLLDSWGKYTRLGDAQRIKQWLEGPEPRPKVIRRRAKHRR
jgi:D-alanyl-D-alanine endopeptidase (penicillin-binding protein 7)